MFLCLYNVHVSEQEYSIVIGQKPVARFNFTVVKRHTVQLCQNVRCVIQVPPEVITYVNRRLSVEAYTWYYECKHMSGVPCKN